MLGLYQLELRRRELVEEIDAIRSMRIGTLSEWYNKVKNKKGEVVLNGPYQILTRKGADNKTISESISDKDVPRIREEVDNYKCFKQLTDEYAEVCEKLSQLAGFEDEGKKTEHTDGVRGRNQQIRVKRDREDGIRGNGDAA